MGVYEGRREGGARERERGRLKCEHKEPRQMGHYIIHTA